MDSVPNVELFSSRCENTYIGAELVALPREEVTEEQMAVFAADAARILPGEQQLVELPETGEMVPIIGPPDFIYSGNDGTRNCKSEILSA